MVKITVESFLERLKDEAFIATAKVNIRLCLEAQGALLLRRAEDAKAEVDLTQKRIAELRCASEHIHELFPHHFQTIKTQYLMQELVATIGQRLDNLEFEEIAKKIADVVTDSRAGLASIVGQNRIKLSLVERVYSFLNGMDWMDCFQGTVMTGRSGCGKTSMAHVMARFFCASGMLITDRVVCVSPQDVVAGYVGQSAPKMRGSLSSALGGVWYLDEGDGLTSSSYGRESLAQLVYFTQEFIGLFVPIITGYHDATHGALFDQNEGMSRRFPPQFRYRFQRMKPASLCLIFARELERRTRGRVKMSEEHSSKSGERSEQWILASQLLEETRVTTGGVVVNMAAKTAMSCYSSLEAPEEVWREEWADLLEAAITA